MDRQILAAIFIFSFNQLPFHSARPSSLFSYFTFAVLFLYPAITIHQTHPLPRQLGSYGTAALHPLYFPRFNPTLPLDYYSFSSPTGKQENKEVEK
jgi:hypothetical protein